ncbi:hypothetical protein BC833DRAFT_648711 [Globomyces pollinis-pini]|nr:hypothetical protein BC833DRAFT_648711 [Globomyces pollinis-pini]
MSLIMMQHHPTILNWFNLKVATQSDSCAESLKKVEDAAHEAIESAKSWKIVKFGFPFSTRIFTSEDRLRLINGLKNNNQLETLELFGSFPYYQFFEILHTFINLKTVKLTFNILNEMVLYSNDRLNCANLATILPYTNEIHMKGILNRDVLYLPNHLRFFEWVNESFFDDITCETFRQFYMNCPQLQAVHIRQFCPTKKQHLEKFLSIFLEKSNLLELTFSFQDLTIESVSIMAKIIAKHEDLETLVLDIKDGLEMNEELQDAFVSHKTLQTLTLPLSNINAVGINKLISTIQILRKLTLIIDMDDIQLLILEELLFGLEWNDTLVVLDILNSSEDSTYAEVSEVFQSEVLDSMEFTHKSISIYWDHSLCYKSSVDFTFDLKSIRCLILLSSFLPLEMLQYLLHFYVSNVSDMSTLCHVLLDRSSIGGLVKDSDHYFRNMKPFHYSDVTRQCVRWLKNK